MYYIVNEYSEAILMGDDDYLVFQTSERAWDFINKELSDEREDVNVVSHELAMILGYFKNKELKFERSAVQMDRVGQLKGVDWEIICETPEGVFMERPEEIGSGYCYVCAEGYPHVIDIKEFLEMILSAGDDHVRFTIDEPEYHEV